MTAPTAPRPVDVHALPAMLTALRLPSFQRHWQVLAERADAEGWPASRFLAALAELELAERDARRIQRHLQQSQLPGGKTLATLDFKVLPGVTRARPDPLAKVTEDLKGWFDEDPSQTGRELLCRLQAAHPDAYPDALIRTVQRRVKIWRGDMARALVFGANGDARKPMTPDALRDMEASRDRGHRETTEPDIHGSENLREQMAEATT